MVFAGGVLSSGWLLLQYRIIESTFRGFSLVGCTSSYDALHDPAHGSSFQQTIASTAALRVSLPAPISLRPTQPEIQYSINFATHTTQLVTICGCFPAVWLALKNLKASKLKGNKAIQGIQW
jgi:hypothetical protein